MITYQRIALVAALISSAACGGRPATVSGTTAGGAQAPAQSISINDGESLVRAMHARYADRWFRTLTYVQTTTLVGQSGPTSDQTWYVALTVPGRMRVDYGNPELGNGILFRADTNYQISNGRQSRTSDGWNELLVLTHDVYLQQPEVTVSILRSLGFQMSRIRTSNFDGRTVYVVGSATQTDSTSRQFWVERDRLVLVRIREKRGEGQFSDIRLGDFVAVGDGFVARQTYQIVNGSPRLHQQIASPQANVDLDPALFDPRQWLTAKHWLK